MCVLLKLPPRGLRVHVAYSSDPVGSRIGSRAQIRTGLKRETNFSGSLLLGACRIPSDPASDPVPKYARGLSEKRISVAACCSEPVGSRIGSRAQIRAGLKREANFTHCVLVGSRRIPHRIPLIYQEAFSETYIFGCHPGF